MKKNLLRLLLLTCIISSHVMKAELPATLHRAAEYNDVPAIRFLISQGADVNATNQYGDTPLHVAARNNSVQAINELIAAGANTQILNRLGQTPLHIAAQQQNIRTIEALTGVPVSRALLEYFN